MKSLYLALFGLVVACASPSVQAERHPSSAQFTDVVRQSQDSAQYCHEASEGNVCLMNWQEALQYCESQNAHLPTAREYANLIKPRGSQVLEADEVKGEAPKGFYLVESRNAEGSYDSFYMNHSGYKRPAGETENYRLWTASAPPSHPQYAHVYYTEWGGGGGDPKEHLKTYRNAVQCVLQ